MTIERKSSFVKILIVLAVVALALAGSTHYYDGDVLGVFSRLFRLIAILFVH